VNRKALFERKIYDLHREAEILGNKLKGQESPCPVEAIPSGVSMRALEAIVRNRQMQLSALSLGVPFESGERAFTIEGRIVERLPEILEAKGIGVGAIVQKNHGGMPTEPHEVLALLQDDVVVRLNPLRGKSSYEYNAIIFACRATPYQGPITEV
jgi:hypothetical protein